MASSVAASIMLSCRFDELSVMPSGVPSASATTWRFVPGLQRSVWFGPVPLPPPFGHDRGAVERGAAPVQPICIAQLPQQNAVERMPYTRGMPLAQSSPAGHVRTDNLGGDHLPWNAGAQDKDNPRQGGTIRYPRTATLRFGRLRRQQRLDFQPQRIREKGLARASRNAPAPVLLGALNKLETFHR